jgi:hypothetical protein
LQGVVPASTCFYPISPQNPLAPDTPWTDFRRRRAPEHVQGADRLSMDEDSWICFSLSICLVRFPLWHELVEALLAEEAFFLAFLMREVDTLYRSFS